MVTRKLWFYLFIWLFGILVIAGCTKSEPALISNGKLEKRLEANSWRKTSFNNTDIYIEHWAFKDGVYVVTNTFKSNGTVKGTYSGTYRIRRDKKFWGGVRLEILTKPGGDIALKGTYEPVQFTKKVLRFAADGREDDGNPQTIEGGLKMIEFVKE